jgi:hypothetical protein
MPPDDIGQKFLRIIELRVSEGYAEDQIVEVLGSHGIKIAFSGGQISLTEAEWHKFLPISSAVFGSLEKLLPKKAGVGIVNRRLEKKDSVDNELDEIRRLADQGDSSAQFQLGLHFGKPDAKTTNHLEAVKWYRMAAKGGHAEAHGKIAFRYALGGYGLPEDSRKATDWYRRGAELGDAFSQTSLAVLYCEGDGVRQDFAEAVKLLRSAANQGHAPALRSLGNMYYTGKGVLKDHTEALTFFAKAAEMGDSEAQDKLGAMYGAGEGVKKNAVEAEKWKRKAKEQNYEPMHSERKEEVVTIRDRKGNLMGEFPLKEIRFKAEEGTLDLECEMKLASDGQWLTVGDFIPASNEKRRAERELGLRPQMEVLQNAAKAGDCELIKWLLVENPELLKQPNHALIMAIQHGHVACVRLLVARGANLADAKVIRAACERGDREINRFLNPANDEELASLLESASVDAKTVKQSEESLKQANRELATLVAQAKLLPPEGRHGIYRPKCPTCGSPDIERITLASKGIAAAIFGIFSIGYAGKSYACRNCQHKW